MDRRCKNVGNESKTDYNGSVGACPENGLSRNDPRGKTVTCIMSPKSILEQEHFFFIGIAGAGMSAIAQYLAGSGKQVSGSDRYFLPDEFNDTREKLEALGIQC